MGESSLSAGRQLTGKKYILHSSSSSFFFVAAFLMRTHVHTHAHTHTHTHTMIDLSMFRCMYVCTYVCTCRYSSHWMRGEYHEMFPSTKKMEIHPCHVSSGCARVCVRVSSLGMQQQRRNWRKKNVECISCLSVAFRQTNYFLPSSSFSRLRLLFPLFIWPPGTYELRKREKRKSLGTCCCCCFFF